MPLILFKLMFIKDPLWAMLGLLGGLGVVNQSPGKGEGQGGPERQQGFMVGPRLEDESERGCD